VNSTGHSRRLLRVAAWAFGIVVALAAALLLAVRYLLFPALGQRADEIAAAVSRAVGERVEIGAVSGAWDGPRIRLDLKDVRVLDAAGTPALALQEAAATVAWRSLLLGKPALAELELRGPALVIERDPNGALRVAGIATSGGGNPSTSGNALRTLLGADALVIEQGRLEWRDASRGAPPLMLERVDARVVRNGRRYTVTATAAPPPALGSTVELRADLTLSSGDALDTASGTASVSATRIDLAAWRPWVDFPAAVQRGTGDARIDAALADGRASRLSADVDLHDLAVYITPERPEVMVPALKGRVILDAADATGARHIAAQGLTMQMASGATLGPLDLDLQTSAAGGDPVAGSVAIGRLDLAVLLPLADMLPVPDKLRGMVRSAAPQGVLTDARVQWSGPLDAPRELALRAKLAGVSMRPVAGAPGVERLSGDVSWDERAASVMLTQGRVHAIAVPGLAQTLVVDNVKGAASLARSAAGVSVKLDAVTVSNADAEATVSGTLVADAQDRWTADLSADVPRLEGASLHRYLPAGDAATWMRAALLRMPVSDGRVRVKGALAAFPFVRASDGTFEATGTVRRGRLAYARGWPVLEDIEASLRLAAGDLRADFRRAAQAGVPLNNGTAIVSGIFGSQAKLDLESTVLVPLEGLLKFVAESPLREVTNRLLDGWSADGSARLALRLELPIADASRARTVAALEFLDNDVVTTWGRMEPVTGVRGTVRIDGRVIRTENLRASVFGGPVAIMLQPAPDGASLLQATGTANFGSVARALDVPSAVAPTGSASYRVHGELGRPGGGLRIESDLKGVALALPAPFGKSAEALWPTSIERRQSGGEESFDIALGPLIRAVASVRNVAGRLALERAALSVGAGAPVMPAHSAIDVAIRVPSFDADALVRWLRTKAATASPARTAFAGDVSVSLATGTLALLGRRLNDVDATVRSTGPRRWAMDLRSREVSGRLTYAANGRGAVTADLQRLAFPRPDPAAAPASSALATAPTTLPALTLTAQSLVVDDRDIGRLEISAQNVGAEWRLDRLAIVSPDCRLDANGVHVPAVARTPQRSSLSFKLDVANIGDCLQRVRGEAAIAGGTATLSGKVAWRGPIYALDRPTLGGAVNLQAQSGQFVNIRQGAAGTLLSVFSLRALGDIATLDFRNVFRDGFAFSRLAATGRIVHGVLTTQDFAMDGPAASVALSGTVDLTAETQDLTVRVAPALSGAVGAGLALVNPLLGAGALVASRLFRPDRLGSLVFFDYRVTGSWQQPTVARGS
jgi:uncharacterized protein (TIGR02099 family)